MFRSARGSVAYHPEWQCAQASPAYQRDPSLAIQSLTFQIKKASGRKELIFPRPYTDGAFLTPPWFS